MIEFIASNEIARLAALALVFFLVLAGVASAGTFWSNRRATHQQLEELALPARGGAKAISLREDKSSRWYSVLDRIESSGLSLADTRGDELRQKLVAAGFRSENAPRLFTLSRVFLVLFLPSFLFLIASLSGQEMSLFQLYFFGTLFAVLGLYLPNLVVSAKASRREDEIRKGFPDSLDLMLVCVEAGLGLDAAMDRVGREMINSQPLISELLSMATLQMRAGASREEALRKMADLSGVDEIRSFSTLLIQSDKMGTSVGDTLRVYADEMREKRKLRAEEKAHRLPVLISIPLVVCMLPTMIGVLMIPGVVRMVRELVPALGG